MSAKRATVEGKGRKTRPVYFGRTTVWALWTYLKEDGRESEDAFQDALWALLNSKEFLFNH